MRNFKESVVYQIYIKSFYDSNGDGIGDLNGITQKLHHLKELGIDYVWITPFYKSPLVDNGYDVADYLSIDEKFGTFLDFDNLIKRANELEIGIMLDMVFNHTSTEHEWFKKALEGNDKYKDYYIFKEGKEGREPTNWISKFGGNAWQKTNKENEYYLHLFDKTQADLNWDNESLRHEIFDIMDFWIKKGVKGFRFDVINLISKPCEFKDSTIDDGRHFYTDGPNIYKYIKELNKNTFGKDKSLVTVGEMSSTSIDNCIKYSNPEENELNMVFSFHHLKVDYENGNKWTMMPYDFMKLKELISTWQVGMENGNGWNAVFLNNHDQPRAISRFTNDKEFHDKSAKLLATFIHTLRGTPYIYQGEEIGMTNAYFNDINLYNDVESKNYYNILKREGKNEKEIIEILMAKSRDNARTPMQWNNEKNYGFTKSKPWLHVGLGKSVTLEDNLINEDSIFNYYKKLIELRHTNKVISEGSFVEILKDNKKVFAYKRILNKKELTIILNFKEELIDINKEIGEVKEVFKQNRLLSNYNDLDTKYLRAYEAIIFENEKS